MFIGKASDQINYLNEPPSAQKEPMMTTAPTPAHVLLQTGHLDEMRKWYRTVLDAHVASEGH